MAPCAWGADAVVQVGLSGTSARQAAGDFKSSQGLTTGAALGSVPAAATPSAGAGVSGVAAVASAAGLSPAPPVTATDLEARSTAQARDALQRRLRSRGGTSAGSAAALELARLDYLLGRPADGLKVLERTRHWPRTASQRRSWRFWRARCRAALGRYRAAWPDFLAVSKAWPGCAEADAALLGLADCRAALGQRAQAARDYARLAARRGAETAQALWGLGEQDRLLGRRSAARAAYLRLREAYPESFEAAAAAKRLEGLGDVGLNAASRAPLPKARWVVQVGAYSRMRWAKGLADPLRRHGYRVRVWGRRIAGRLLYLVQVGPYPGRSEAQKAASRLHQREHLPFNIIPE